MYTVGRLARRYGLSRSALLYYDEIGLLSPSARSSSGYRLYDERDVRRLERIITYRDAGLSLDAIRSLLSSQDGAAAVLLERHLQDINEEIARLRRQQHVVSRLLGDSQALRKSRSINKDQWIALLASTGLNEEGMSRWHMEFEHMSPDAHQDFLESIGIEPEEISRIRRISKQKCPGDDG